MLLSFIKFSYNPTEYWYFLHLNANRFLAWLAHRVDGVSWNSWNQEGFILIFLFMIFLCVNLFYLIAVSKWRAMDAISPAWPFSLGTGSPDTTMYASPIVSTYSYYFAFRLKFTTLKNYVKFLPCKRRSFLLLNRNRYRDCLKALQPVEVWQFDYYGI